jgi:Protein of unknown function (DUF1800)
MQALVRFGLGRRRTEPPPGDPAAWLRDQVRAPAPGAPSPSLAEALAALRADRAEKPAPGKARSRALFVRDAQAHVAAALTAEAPFRERLVWFWANHFTVSARRGQCAALIGPFVAKAIRPRVGGRFADMASRRARRAGSRRSRTSPRTRRRTATSRPSSRAISSPTTRRRTPCAPSRARCAMARAISAPRPRP